jgi:hypothetical protein
MQAPAKFPDAVIKAIDSSARLEDFLAGKFRLSRIEYFKTIENKNRRDETEGTAEYVVQESITSVHLPDEILASLARFCVRTSNSGH